MFKKLSIAGLALLASSGIAFADTSDSMPATDTSASDTAASSTDASMDNATGDNSAASSTTTTSKATAHKKHKKHKKHHHKRHHHRAVAAADQDPVAAAAPAGDYKGEVSPCAPAACPHNTLTPGFYAGFSVGSRVNYSVSRGVGIGGVQYNGGATNFTGVDGTLFGGYGMSWDQWYGALEILAQNTAEISSNTNYLGSTKSTWGFGVSVLPGYMITDDVLGYLRVGYIGTKFTSGNKYLSGGQVGLGLDTALCTNWDLRGEWVYSFYNNAVIGNPQSQVFNLGLIYKFQA